MKAYVIKNKDGKYFVTIFGKPIFSKEISDAYMNADKQNLNYIINDKSIKDCTIVPITICEGDLVEENRVLKAKLETAEYWNRKYDDLQEEYQVLKKAFKLSCEELETRDEGKTHARLFLQKIKNNKNSFFYFPQTF